MARKRQSRKKTNKKIYKGQRPGYQKTTTQETDQRFKPLKTRQGLIYRRHLQKRGEVFPFYANTENKGLPNLETVEAKHSSDAEQQSQEETTEAPNSETPLELATSDDDISISSAAEATLDTESQLDSQNEEGADINPRKARRCNRWTPGSYATMHVGRPKAQKRKER